MNPKKAIEAGLKEWLRAAEEADKKRVMEKLKKLEDLLSKSKPRPKPARLEDRVAQEIRFLKGETETDEEAPF